MQLLHAGEPQPTGNDTRVLLLLQGIRMPSVTWRLVVAFTPHTAVLMYCIHSHLPPQGSGFGILMP